MLHRPEMAALLGVFGWCLLALSCLLVVPALVLLLEIAAAAFGASARQDGDGDLPGTIAVLMPAHDEALGIAASIASVRRQLRDGDRLLVVADNCSDTTAVVAREAGAEVVERDDPSRRGKGFALDFGVRHLEPQPPSVVVIVDADCVVGAGSLERLAAVSLRRGRPAQALYLMSRVDGGLRARIAEFAWIVRNHVRPFGASRLGMGCQLMGTGMAFPWPVIERAPLASGHLVEDLQLGLALAADGYAPVFCPEARVTSVFPAQAEATLSQRMRWERGHLSMIASQGPRLLALAAVRRRPALLALALDLCVPPLALLVLMIMGLVVLGTVVAVLGGPAAPWIVSASTLAGVTAAVLVAWARFGRAVLSLRELLGSPAYAITKVSMYARLFASRQAEWIRTRRDKRE
jgi:cellulose synthase/poly-beta-1,6-N-acetylglucosamine synthase-like glycosyltransferase